jgi:uncharacterized membrane protein YgcG
LLTEHRESPFLPVSINASSGDLAIVESHLAADELVEWVGKPDPTRHFTTADVYLIPFSLVFFAVAVFWVIGATTAGGVFGLFGVPFLAIGLYNLFGRFIYKANRKRRTIYAVTTRRVLEIIRSRRGETVRATYLRSIPNISTSAATDGHGSVEFVPLSPPYSQLANSGMEFFAHGRLGSGVSFYDIEDPRGVADLVERLRAGDSA